MRHLGLLTLAATLTIPAVGAAQAVDEVTYYHLDAVGSVRAITNANQQVVATYDYLPFGEAWPNAGTSTNMRRFAGNDRDAETAFEYFGARYVSSREGRFTTVDPDHIGGNLFDPQSWNAYAYARNNPFRFVDPTGTDFYINPYYGGTPFWFSQGFGDMQSFKRYLNDQRFSILGDSERGYIVNAQHVVVATYSHSDRSAWLLGSIARTAGPTVNGLAVATGVVVGGVSAYAVATGGLAASTESIWLGSTREFGNIVGWGTGQATSAATRKLAQTLTSEAVKGMIRRGLTRSIVEEQLAVYERALLQGGAKLANTQLVPRIEVLRKILQLWP